MNLMVMPTVCATVVTHRLLTDNFRLVVDNIHTRSAIYEYASDIKTREGDLHLRIEHLQTLKQSINNSNSVSKQCIS